MRQPIRNFVFAGVVCLCLYRIDASIPLVQAESRFPSIDPRAMKVNFENAAIEFGVPSAVLKAIACAETRWNHSIPEKRDSLPIGLPGEEHPPLYGIMGLRDDDWFGHSLILAASLIKLPVAVLETDPRQNIRGAAALLRSLAKNQEAPENPTDWIGAVKSYSGIPDDADANLYAEEVFRMVRDGFQGEGFQLEPRGIRLPETLTPPHRADPRGPPRNPGDQDTGIDWDPSPNFDPNAIRQLYIIIHDTEGSFAGSVSWFKNPAAKVSSHFIIRSSDGYTKQLIHETDRAWHVRCWNAYALGIESEGFVNTPSFYTEIMYQKTAALAKRLANNYHIPVDQAHIVGHDFWKSPSFQNSFLAQVGNCNDHTDPGPYWNWTHFLNLVLGMP